MSLVKYVVVGAATVYLINYLTKKRLTDGKSILDDLGTPKIVEDVKQFGKRVKLDYEQTTSLY